ncbi:hypothetical protein J6590_002935 [Homalodisca vitripennis]|nr:hypothetical protein J6590_002935 [Homalodisca vitripennis]
MTGVTKDVHRYDKYSDTETLVTAGGPGSDSDTLVSFPSPTSSVATLISVHSFRSARECHAHNAQRIAARSVLFLGGVLSLLLWNLGVDELLVSSSNSGLFTPGYADDIEIIMSGKFNTTIKELTNAALNIVGNWWSPL